MINKRLAKIKTLVVFSCALVSYGLNGAEAKSSPASMKVVVIEYSSAPVGEVKAFLAHDAFRLDFPTSHAYLVAKGPKWDVVIFNPETRKGFKMALPEWLSRPPIFHYISEDWPRAGPILKVGTDTKSGQSCTKYVLASQGPNGTLIQKRTGATAVYFVADHFDAPKETCYILQRTFNAPKAEGLPVEILVDSGSSAKPYRSMTFNTGGKLLHLSVQKLSSAVVANSVFDYPEKYQPVHREIEVINDSVRKLEVEDLLREQK